MVGEKKPGSNVLFFIEWKYTEEYGDNDKYIPARYEIYNPLLEDEHSPIVVEDYRSLYYEPFYQLMRQTLLGWKMVEDGENHYDEWIHVHVIPEGNVEMRERVTSPGLRLRGTNMSDVWKSVLRDPARYMTITPEEFLRPACGCPDMHSIAAYLEKRYWS